MYRGIDIQDLPSPESLKTTIERVVPYFENCIKPAMLEGKRVLITAHGNSLRSLVKYFDGIADDDIVDVNIPTGIPLVYEFDENFNAIKHYYLGDQKAIIAKMAATAAQGQIKSELIHA